MEDTRLAKREKKFLKKYMARKRLYLLFSFMAFAMSIILLYFSFSKDHHLILRLWRIGSLCSLTYGFLFLGIAQTENMYFKIISKIK